MEGVDRDAAREAAKLGAKGNLIDEFRAYAFYAYGLSFKTETGILVHPIEMPTGNVRIAIVILEDTTIKQLEKSWWEIDKWRNALIEWQGAPQDETNNFYERISKAQAEGISYNQLAKQINQRIGELLTEYSVWLDDKTNFEKQFGEYNLHLWFNEYMKKPEHNHRPATFKFAGDLLSYCRPRLNEEQKRILLEDALKRIQNGQPPFPPNDKPVQGRRDVRERIDYWREKQKGVGNTP